MLKEPNAVSSDNKFVPQSFMLFFKKNSAVKTWAISWYSITTKSKKRRPCKNLFDFFILEGDFL